MTKTGNVILAALCLTSFASADTIDASRLTAPLKLAYDSLGQMGLTIEKATRKFISGRYSVAVPKSAIIEEQGKAYVVILDPQNPSMSDRHEVVLGNRSDEYVHTQNVVSSGDYVVARKEKAVTKVVPQTYPAPRAQPVTVPNRSYPRQIARAAKPSTPYPAVQAPVYSQPARPVAQPVVKQTYNPPPVSQRSYANRSTPQTYQPTASAVPVSTYQPQRAPVEPYREEFGYNYNPAPRFSGTSDCSICNERAQEPEPCAYSRGQDYYEEPYNSGSGCFTEPLCRAFRNWFN